MAAEHDAGARTSADVPMRASVLLDADNYASLKTIAKKEQGYLAWVVRDALSDHLHARNHLFSRGRRGEAL